MTKIVLQDEDTEEYVGEYESNIIPRVGELVGSMYEDYKVIDIRHNLSHKLEWQGASLKCVTLRVRKQ